ncbi:MAG: tetratricopeptide repeat protein [Xanthomonadales bacterium]|nr:tetratricopeptide repeat protein [Xanthomonadales bacterium]
MLCGAGSAWSNTDLSVPLRPLQPVELTIEGGQTAQLELPANDIDSDGPWILLLRQRDIDIELRCGNADFHSAPTGRIGIDAEIVNGSATCVIRPKMPHARPGRINITLYTSGAAPLGADLALWERLLQAHRQGESQPEQDAAIAALEHIEVANTYGEFTLSAVYARGKLRMRRSLSDDALIDLRLAAGLAEQHDLRHFLPAIHNGAGLTLLKTHDLAEAERAFQWAERIAVALGQGYEQASALNNQGLVDQHRGDLRSAARHYQAALQAYRKAGESEHVAVAMMNHATVTGQLGQVREAREALREVIEMRRQGPNRRSLALALQNFGQLTARIGDWPSALASTLEAQEIHEALGQPADLIGIYLIRSQLFLNLGQLERSRHYADRAQRQLAPSVAALLTPAVLSMQAKAAQTAADAITLHRAAAAGFRENRRHADAAAELIDLAEAAAELGDWTTAQQALSETRLEVLRSQHRLRARHHLVAARLQLSQGDAAGSVALLSEAANIFATVRDHRGAYQTALAQADAELQRADATAALTQLSLAVDAQEHLLASVPTPNLAASLRIAQRPWKDIAIELALTHADEPQQLHALITLLERWSQPAADAFLPADLLEAYRYKISALANDDLSEAIRAELTAELEALESNIEAQGRMRPAAAGMAGTSNTLDQSSPSVVVRYLVGTQRSLLLVQQRQEVWVEALPGREVLGERVRHGLMSPWTFEELARLLYPARLRDADLPFVVVPDEALHDAPLAALWQTVSKLKVSAPVVSTTGVVARSQLRSPGPALRVASLLPAGESAPELTGVGIERTALSKLLGSRFLPVNLDGETDLALPEAEIIHVAGHGWVSRTRPMASAIADLPFGSSANSPLVDPTRLQTRIQPRLIVLSACEGAGSDAFGSGYSLALSYAQHFGAPVVAPTEPIDDGDAAAFTRVLFERLQSKDIRSAFDEALASTQGTNLRHYAPWQLIVP